MRDTILGFVSSIKHHHTFLGIKAYNIIHEKMLPEKIKIGKCHTKKYQQKKCIL